MGIFDKNKNEEAYVGGKKHIVDVIKNSAPSDVFIWRQPEEDFNTNSTLIVMPGEEAIFVNEGIIEQVFDNGTYKLSTENYPFISRLRNAFSGGISSFNSVVYFVRKSDSKELKWGTHTPIQVRDKAWGIMTDAKARGSYKIRVSDSGKLLTKLIGSNTNVESYEELEKYFANELQTKIKANISKFLNSYEKELIGIDAYIDEISKTILPSFEESLSEYGVKCVNFSIAGIDIDTSKYNVIDKSQMELIAKQRSFQGDKAGIDILGENWGKVQAAGIMKDMANNSQGNIASLGGSLGAGIGIAGAFSQMTKEVFDNQNSKNTDTTNKDRNVDDYVAKLEKFKKMLEQELITKEEFDEKKKEILSKI